MKDKIKIRTMKDDLANTENEELSEVNSEIKQDQNKIKITPVEPVDSDLMPGTTPSKLKDKEVNELKDLIKRISKNTDKKIPEEKQTKKEDAVMDTTSEKIVSEQEKQADSKIDEKGDEKKELKDLVSRVSKTIEKKDNRAVQTENLEDKLDNKKEVTIEIPEKNKQSFWSNISEKLKSDKLPESQKIDKVRKKDQITTESVKDIKNASEESAKEKYSSSGVLTKKESLETKEEKENEEDKKETKKSFHDDNYQLPENRLIFGKQERYSSVSKRIKLKDEKDEIESLKNTDEIKEEQKTISEKEEYKKLKNRVIKKYNIKLFSLPWKRIILISTILITLAGAIYYVLVRELTPEPVPPPQVFVGTEIETFAKIKDEIEFTKDEIVKTTNLERVKINKEFRLNGEVEELRIIIKHDNNIIELKEALESLRIKTVDFPIEFWGKTTGSYNILALKTEKDTFRFAIAIESNDITSLMETMRDWERESVDKRKMFNVFEPLFADSKVDGDFDQHFKSTNYKYVYIRYVNLPDKNTSFDYFASDNSLVIATSEENANRIINILDNNNYDYHESYEN